MSYDVEAARQLDRHIRAPRQVWLTGAGISCEAGLPLMNALTDRVFYSLREDEANTKVYQLVEAIRDDLPEKFHIEHILSHFGDLVALAERSRDQCAFINEKRMHKTELQAAHHKILSYIRDILRWGYVPASKTSSEQVGESGKSIVNIKDHRRFIKALYKVNRAGLDEHREAIQFITTNYDTLIEDALALELIPYIDGFSGGAIASWNEQSFHLIAPEIIKAAVTKLHGSIDWYRCGNEKGRVFRVRHDDLYPDRSEENGNVVIYPQSTKYMASREDPFGFMFQRFRDLLSPERQQVLFICGYSFGDDHINAIIEQYLLHPDSKTTLIAFSKDHVPKVKNWGESSAGERIFVLTEEGLYRGKSGPFFKPTDSVARKWWTFAGVTSLLEDGLPTDIAEAIE